ncbi:hypothetical protein BKA93DRAFT_828624 [Sparassis latifolia]
MSPSHHVDVPQTQRQSRAGTWKSLMQTSDPTVQGAPAPGKYYSSTSSTTRPQSEGVVKSPESSPVKRTSHATFIAPALPPIRIAMGGTDFSDLFKSVGGDVPKLDQLKEANEDGQY